MHRSIVRSSTALIALGCALLAAALPHAARGDGDANGGTGVARISVLEGTVSLQRGDGGTVSAAVMNAPVLGTDYVTTGPSSRAEVQFDALTSARLGPNVQLRFTRIDTGDRELQLAEGTIAVRLLRASDAQTQVDTPSISVRPRAAGSYRISVDAGGATRVTVRSGRAEIVTPDGIQMLTPGTTLAASGPAASPTITAVSALANDDFDTFNAERDVRELRALASAYAPPGVAGIDDLDAYGRWVNDGTYGTVWAPSYVAPGWVPYRDGRWVYEGAYGWTWVGYEPWGWAPYHYGRWYHSAAYGWCWVPARAIVPWSPALVAFVTFGGIGTGFNTIGWVPLAPFETFTPWWGYNHTTIVNVTNVYDGAPHHHGPIARPFYRNWRDGAGTAVAKERFLEGRFDRRVAVTPALMRAVHVVHGPVPVTPTQADRRLGEGPVAHVAMPRSMPPPESARLTATPVDSWSRFANARNAHPVTVITGSAVTAGKSAGSARGAAPVTQSVHGSAAWTRFDAAAGTRAATPREATVIREPVIRTDAGRVQRYEQPVRHDAPPAVHHDAPPAAHHDAPPAVHHEPPHSESHARTTTTSAPTHHR